MALKDLGLFAGQMVAARKLAKKYVPEGVDLGMLTDADVVDVLDRCFYVYSESHDAEGTFGTDELVLIPKDKLESIRDSIVRLCR